MDAILNIYTYYSPFAQSTPHILNFKLPVAVLEWSTTAHQRKKGTRVVP
jgi:hypothetical protein